MPELLLELYSEDIPARMQPKACRDLERLMAERLEEARLEYSDMRAFATPRRLTLVVEGLPERQPDRQEEKRGPRVDAPEKAIEGFKGSLPEGAEIEEREEKKGKALYAVIERKGRESRSVLDESIPLLIYNFPWPKSMRSGRDTVRWVRPLRNVFVLFDGEFLPISLAGADIWQDQQSRELTATEIIASRTRSDRKVLGHRFLVPDPIEVTDFADYKAKLEQAYVLLDPEARKARIREGAQKLADAEGLKLPEDEVMIAENAGLTEWPVPLIGGFDPAFLEVPEEALISAMRNHQKYLPLTDPATGKLAPRFICVADTEAPDGGKAIAAGNERVLSARLSDARFFWEQDLKTPLEERVDDLTGMVFHEKLGSMAERVNRIEALAGNIAKNFVSAASVEQVRRAARLAKADLTTEMVGEFPELQGTMGRYYAREQGEPEAVARAIEAHYAPKGPTDACPSDPVSVCVALAEKIDSLVGFFAIGETPTGSKDPFALRRAALGVIRLILENRVRFSLKATASNALENLIETLHQNNNYIIEGASYEHQNDEGNAEEKAVWVDGYYLYFSSDMNYNIFEITKSESDSGIPEAIKIPGEVALSDSLLSFFAERLKVQQREKGVRHDLIDAVFSLGGEDDLVRLLARVQALQAFVETEDGANLLAGYKRAANILKAEEKREGTQYGDSVPDPELFQQSEERALQEVLTAAKQKAGTALAAEDFEAAMRALASLRAPIDAFFEAVTVNAEDAALRRNRLALLAQIRAAADTVADFAQIEG